MPEVQSFIKTVKDYIDTQLGQVMEPMDHRRLHVCVCCSTGTHLSPCCVERLYELYSNKPQLVSDLVVHRQHVHGEKWAKRMRERHNLVWQRTQMAVKYFISPEELTNERMWQTVPLAILPLIEEEFQKDPFNSACRVGRSGERHSYQVNFVTGELYSHSDMKVYRLRCVIRDIDTRVECGMLDGPSYKNVARHYGAAGVLFYSTHPATGEPIFLLGHMNYSTESWCDFGGLKSFR